MDFMLAKTRDAQQVYGLVQETIQTVYPKYYLKEIVDMFCPNIKKEAMELLL